MSQIQPSILQSQNSEIVVQALDDWSIHISDVDEFMDELTIILRVFFPLLISIDHRHLFYGNTLHFLFIPFEHGTYIQKWCRSMIAKCYAKNSDFFEDIFLYTEMRLSDGRYSHIRYFKGLQELNVFSWKGSMNWITSLQNLTSLEIYTLVDSDISPLYDLNSLTHLRIVKVINTPIDIQRLTQLQEIHLSKISITKCPSLLNSLTSLRTLDLKYSHIRSLPDDLSLPSSLDVCKLPLERFAAPFSKSISLLPSLTLDTKTNHFLSIMPQLKHLHIREHVENEPLNPTGLTYLQLDIDAEEMIPWLKKCTNLKVLRLTSYRLQSLPDWISNCSQLRELHVSKTGISLVPDWIGQLHKLELLDCSKNHIAKLPSGIAKLTNLIYLNLSDNKISKMVIYLRNCKRLQHIDVHNNRIGKCPSWIVEFIDLRILNMAGNNLITIPNDINKLQHLHTLDIAYNRLQELPLSLTEIHSLKRITVNHNKLKILPKWTNHLSSITKLDLSSNKLETLPTWIEQCINLKELNLSKNPLKQFPNFKNMISLQKLKLEELHISTIPESLHDLSNLRTLSLYKNKITHLPSSLLSIHFLDTINVKQNPNFQFPTWLNQFEYLTVCRIDFGIVHSLHPEDVPLPDDSFLLFQISKQQFVSIHYGDYKTDPDLIFVY